MKKTDLYLYLVLFGFLFFLISCQSTSANNHSNPDYIKGEKYVSKTGVSYILKQKPTKKAHKYDIIVELQGFKKTNQGHNFRFSNPIHNVFFMDLDTNGYEEIYIVTQAEAKNKAQSVVGMSSNVDMSASPIEAPDIMMRARSKTGFYKGFGGYNKIYNKDGKIVEEYPIKNLVNSLGDTIIGAVIDYNLSIFDNKWVLTPSYQRQIKKK